jgi:hypothetical protein
MSLGRTFLSSKTTLNFLDCPLVSFRISVPGEGAAPPPPILTEILKVGQILLMSWALLHALSGGKVHENLRKKFVHIEHNFASETLLNFKKIWSTEGGGHN